MSTKEGQEKFIGRTGKLRVGALYFPVKIIDHRFLFGRDDVRITPVGGEGEQWVNVDGVALDK